jgi:hypothetical protein
MGFKVDAEREIVRARETFTGEIVILLALLGHKVEAEIAILNISDNYEVVQR